jgi:DNA helicase-2/ATP-dependent DNA helicase PcrA
MNTGLIQIPGLNDAQLTAVASTEGPLLIVAGAGTGKTKVITSRILYLLLEKKIPSSEIAALTFTEKAANEMIERIDIAMPLSYEEATIKTFHSFCDQILREKGIEIGIDPSYKILTQTDEWIYFKKNLFSFELDYYRPLGNPGKFIHILLNHFSRLKDEYISPEKYLEYANKIKDEEEKAKMLELANVYKKFQEIKLSQNLLDFSDLQYYALKLLEKRKSVLGDYQERYRYFMVDEFQDTNYIQSRIIFLLAARHKNITVVGDDDQSIYKWRGASLSNILGFKKAFPDTKEIVLTQNYRSSQKILDLSYSIIQNNNPTRLESTENINKKLRTNIDELSPPEVWHFNSYLEEARAIVLKIQKLKENGADYKDFAILVRTNNLTTPYTEALKENGIPFTVRDMHGLLRYEEIKDILALLKFLVRPQNDTSFFRLLSLPLFNIPMGSVLEITDAARHEYSSIFYYIKKHSDESSETFQLLKNAYVLFDGLLNFIRRNNVARTIGEFLDKSGYYISLTKEEKQINEEKIRHIAQFLEIAREFETAEADNGISDFLDYLESLEEASGVMAETPDSDSDSVSVLTVHSAKGLEFDCVFLPSLVANRFPCINKKEPISIPDSLIIEDLSSGDIHINEERRLFYVACTRAARKLFLSYSDYYEGSKKWKISPFLTEALSSGDLTEKDFTGKKKTEFLTERKASGIAKKPESEYEKKISEARTVDVNRLTYSQIDTFQTCPLKYKFRYLFNIPSLSAHAANFGSSVHDTVNAFYDEIKKGAAPSMDLLNELYEKHWIGSGYDNRAHEQARKKQGKNIMELFYKNEESAGFKVPAFLESSFNLKIGDISFKGRIDRIDKLEDGTYEVIDYKTGKSKRSANLKKDLQLSLYALACRDFLDLPVSKLTLYFLEDGLKESTTRTNKDLEDIKEVLKEAVEEIRSSSFPASPGFPCGFCEYRILCNKAK